MNTSKCSPNDVLVEHIRGLEDWSEDQFLKAKRLSTQDDAHDKLRGWHRECFKYLTNTLKGLSYPEFFSLRLDRNMIKGVISHAVNSTDGHELRAAYHLTEDEHRLLEEGEIRILCRFYQEYFTIKDRIPSRIKRTPKIEYYLRGITPEELSRQFPRDLEKRGAGARVIEVIKQELIKGHIIKIDNTSEFHRSLVDAFGAAIPKNVQQLSREIRDVQMFN